MNRATSLMTLASLLLVAACAAAGAPADRLKEARDLAAAGDAAGAAARFREIAALPDADAKTKAQALYALAAQSLNALDRFDEALAAYDAIAALEGLPAVDKLAARNRKASTLMRIRTRERVIEMRTIWADIGRDESLTPAQRIKGWIAVANNAAGSSVYANRDEARDALEQALDIEGLTDRDRAEVFAQHIRYALKYKDLAAAADYAKRIIDSEGATVAQKLDATCQLAGVQLKQGDEAAADATVRGALKMPKLADGERAAAFFNIGQIQARLYRHEAARTAFAEAARLAPALKVKAENAMADAWMAEGAYDQAFKLYRESGRVAEAASVLQAQGDREGALRVCREAIGNADLHERDHWAALSRFIYICNAGNLFEEARGLLPEYQALAGDASIRARQLMDLLRNAMTRTVYPFAAEAAEVLVRNGGLSREERFLASLYRVNALAGLGEAAQAAASADTFAQDERLDPLHRFTFALMQALLTAPDKAADTQATIEAVETAFARDELPIEKRQEALLRAGRTAMIARRFTTARAVGAFYESRFVPEPVKTYTVGFLSQAPASIDGFLASSLLRDDARRARLDRKFGGNLELVAATDASTGDRGDIRVTAGATGDTETGFYVVCDDEGIHIFFDARDDQAPEVEAGLLRGGSFEGYLAAGERAPHTCFLVNLQTGKVTLWNSAYATDQHTPVTTDGPGFRGEFRHMRDAHLLYLFFGWELFHDKLPGADDVWLFETARWARGGRVTWNGLKTVHGRSSFGHLRFALSDADRLAIKRKLIYKAHARYTAEKNPRTGGLADFYADQDYADPAFYAEVAEPFIARLDAYGKRITATLGAEEVETLFAEAVPRWMNVRYRISDLRRDYLERKLTAE
jgi:hypothetical protein